MKKLNKNEILTIVTNYTKKQSETLIESVSIMNNEEKKFIFQIFKDTFLRFDNMCQSINILYILKDFFIRKIEIKLIEQKFLNIILEIALLKLNNKSSREQKIKQYFTSKMIKSTRKPIVNLQQANNIIDFCLESIEVWSMLISKDSIGKDTSFYKAYEILTSKGYQSLLKRQYYTQQEIFDYYNSNIMEFFSDDSLFSDNPIKNQAQNIQNIYATLKNKKKEIQLLIVKEQQRVDWQKIQSLCNQIKSEINQLNNNSIKDDNNENIEQYKEWFQNLKSDWKKLKDKAINYKTFYQNYGYESKIQLSKISFQFSKESTKRNENTNNIPLNISTRHNDLPQLSSENRNTPQYVINELKRQIQKLISQSQIKIKAEKQIYQNRIAAIKQYQAKQQFRFNTILKQFKQQIEQKNELIQLRENAIQKLLQQNLELKKMSNLNKNKMVQSTKSKVNKETNTQLSIFQIFRKNFLNENYGEISSIKSISYKNESSNHNFDSINLSRDHSLQLREQKNNKSMKRIYSIEKSIENNIKQVHNNLFGFIMMSDIIKSRLKRCCLRKKQILFKNEDIEIGTISENINQQIKLNLFVTNVSKDFMRNISHSIIYNENEIKVIEHNQIELLSPCEQQKIQILFEILEIPFNIPFLRFDYEIKLVNKRHQIYLPCILLKTLSFIKAQSHKEEKIFFKKVQGIYDEKINKKFLKDIFEKYLISQNQIRIKVYNRTFTFQCYVYINLHVENLEIQFYLLKQKQKMNDERILQHLIKQLTFLLIK